MGAGIMNIVTVLVDPADWNTPDAPDRGCVPVRQDQDKNVRMATDFRLQTGVERKLSDQILRLLGE
jgi:hypothetical protein